MAEQRGEYMPDEAFESGEQNFEHDYYGQDEEGRKILVSKTEDAKELFEYSNKYVVTFLDRYMDVVHKRAEELGQAQTFDFSIAEKKGAEIVLQIIEKLQGQIAERLKDFSDNDESTDLEHDLEFLSQELNDAQVGYESLMGDDSSKESEVSEIIAQEEIESDLPFVESADDSTEQHVPIAGLREEENDASFFADDDSEDAPYGLTADSDASSKSLHVEVSHDTSPDADDEDGEMVVDDGDILEVADVDSKITQSNPGFSGEAVEVSDLVDDSALDVYNGSQMVDAIQDDPLYEEDLSVKPQKKGQFSDLLDEARASIDKKEKVQAIDDSVLGYIDQKSWDAVLSEFGDVDVELSSAPEAYKGDGIGYDSNDPLVQELNNVLSDSEKIDGDVWMTSVEVDSEQAGVTLEQLTDKMEALEDSFDGDVAEELSIADAVEEDIAQNGFFNEFHLESESEIIDIVRELSGDDEQVIAELNRLYGDARAKEYVKLSQVKLLGEVRALLASDSFADLPKDKQNHYKHQFLARSSDASSMYTQATRARFELRDHVSRVLREKSPEKADSIDAVALNDCMDAVQEIGVVVQEKIAALSGDVPGGMDRSEFYRFTNADIEFAQNRVLTLLDSIRSYSDYPQAQKDVAVQYLTEMYQWVSEKRVEVARGMRHELNMEGSNDVKRYRELPLDSVDRINAQARLDQYKDMIHETRLRILTMREMYDGDITDPQDVAVYNELREELRRYTELAQVAKLHVDTIDANRTQPVPEDYDAIGQTDPYDKNEPQRVVGEEFREEKASKLQKLAERGYAIAETIYQRMKSFDYRKIFSSSEQGPTTVEKAYGLATEQNQLLNELRASFVENSQVSSEYVVRLDQFIGENTRAVNELSSQMFESTVVESIRERGAAQTVADVAATQADLNGYELAPSFQNADVQQEIEKFGNIYEDKIYALSILRSNADDFLYQLGFDSDIEKKFQSDSKILSYAFYVPRKMFERMNNVTLREAIGTQELSDDQKDFLRQLQGEGLLSSETYTALMNPGYEVSSEMVTELRNLPNAISSQVDVLLESQEFVDALDELPLTRSQSSPENRQLNV